MRRGLVGDINRIVFPHQGGDWKGFTPPERKPLIFPGCGRATSTPGKPDLRGVLKEISMSERIVVVSDILVQETGAYELPPGWPDQNTYPGMKFADDKLPALGEPYLVHARVHAYVSVLGKDEVGQRHAATVVPEFYVQRLLTFYEQPFTDPKSDPALIIFPNQGKPSRAWQPKVRIHADNQKPTTDKPNLYYKGLLIMYSRLAKEYLDQDVPIEE